MPNVEEVRRAAQVIALAIEIAALEQD